MMKFSNMVYGAVGLAAFTGCSLLPGRGPAPTPVIGAPVSTSAGTVIERPKAAPKKAVGFQIAQCYSAGAPKVGISYPEGWSRRVSRAEIEDELLGGGSSSDLSNANAFAQPVGEVAFTYPSAALNPPTEAVCEIKFNLSRRGDPSRIISACSSDLFLEAATQAVKNTKFKPVRVNGTAAKGVNLTYNMKFCLADE